MKSKNPSLFRLWLLSILVGLVGLAANVSAEPLTASERDAMWGRLQGELTSHPRLVYHDGNLTPPQYPAFIMTNETNYWKMEIPKGKADLHLGFATTMNFNIAAQRDPKVMILVDQSEEAVIALTSFWRPMFLAADSPAEWLTNIAGMEARPGETPEQVFARVVSGEKGTAEGYAHIANKLRDLLYQGKISEPDRDFAIRVVRDQIQPVRTEAAQMREAFARMGLAMPPEPDEPVSVFRNAKIGDGLPDWLAQMHWPPLYGPLMKDLVAKGYAPATPETRRDMMIRSANDRNSFLTPEGFATVKRIFEEGRDYYAQSSMENPALWSSVARFANDKKHELTDLYLSNVPYFVRENNPRFDEALNEFVSQIPNHGVATYEAHIQAPHNFNVTTLPTDCQSALRAIGQ